MIEREVAGAEDLATILASVAVSQQNVLPRKSPCLMRNATVLKEADDGGNAHGHARGVHVVAVFLLGASHSLEHQDDGAAGGANIDWLIGGVQNQNRGVQGHSRFVRDDSFRAGVAASLGADRVVGSQRHGNLSGFPYLLLRSDSICFGGRFEHTSDGGGVNPGGSSAKQNAGALGNRCSGRENIVH